MIQRYRSITEPSEYIQKAVRRGVRPHYLTAKQKHR